MTTLEDLKIKVDGVEETLNSVNDTLKDLVGVIKGNKLNPLDSGIIGNIAMNQTEIKSLKDRIQQLENKDKNRTWFILGAGAGGGLSSVGIWQIIEAIFKH